jgi:hypothetical protein
MKPLVTAALLFVIVSTSCPAIQTNTAAESTAINHIVVRVLNGATGKPITHEIAGTRLGNDTQKNYRTDHNGEVVLTIGASQAKDVEVWLTNFYIDCETYGNEDGQIARFSLDEIISKGLVAENRCGGIRLNPLPGLLIVYKRKMTRKERHLL